MAQASFTAIFLCKKVKELESNNNDYDTNNAKQVTNSENSNYNPRGMVLRTRL